MSTSKHQAKTAVDFCCCVVYRVDGLGSCMPPTEYGSSSESSSLLSRSEDEEASLDANAAPPGADGLQTHEPLSSTAILWIVLPMLLAVFIANADGSIVMATHAIIASEFMALESSSWLYTGFMLASTATQTTLGQLSEIFGRKAIIILCYAVFGLGCLVVGAAHSMASAIAGRILSGAVSAGSNVLVSLVITDLLPVREVATWRSYVNVVAMMFSVPLYFQVTQRVSNTAAGAHLMPAVIGNAIGGIISGYFIRNTGRYKWLVYLATLMSASAYTLLILRWHGQTNWLESLYIFPGGFGTGVALSAVFIAVQASVNKSQVAPAISALYLASGFGTVVGLAAVSATFQTGLRSTLEARLMSMHLNEESRSEILEKALASVEYIYKASGDVAEAITESYVDGLWYSHIVSLGASLLAFLLTPLLREYKL
ncbi:major facilitator superfamily transporter [Diaporthe helianthi]|uniref:Major facilitator superfamily transporter n=1 Tax=Diaporthe helianthi TaxID=158607 RepID=A0A2P5HP11_DIAHE|nr:major facilitator superfamily transporter [Diaporthe helianthi]